MSNVAVNTAVIEQSTTWKSVVAPLAAVLLGFIILYGAGFAPQEVVHNAAHDVRHSAAFPCH